MRQKWIIGIAALAFWLFAAQFGFTVGPMTTADAAVSAPAVAAKANADTVTLTWSATGAPQGFTIQSADFIQGAKTYKAGAAARTFTTGRLPKSNTYHFRMRQETATGPSAWSKITTVKIP
ncbi:MAG: hypothetical protein ACHQ0Y_03245 [Thermodesulfovibrionales bacterium]